MLCGICSDEKAVNERLSRFQRGAVRAEKGKRMRNKIVMCVCLMLSGFGVSSCLCPPEKLDVSDCMLYDRKNGIVLELNEYAEAIEGKLGAPKEKVCLKEDGPGLAIYGSYGQIFRT